MPASPTLSGMTTARKPTIVKVSTLEDIVATVPHLLGFHPRESLVVVALTGPRERMTFTARVDLEPEEHDTDIANYLSGALVRAGADGAFVFVYTDPPHSDLGEGELPRQGLVTELMRVLQVPVRDAVLVADGRVWSYICPDPVCCPPEGRLLDPASPGALSMAAAHALQGDVVLADRDAVVRSLAPLGGIAAAALRQAYDRAFDELERLGDDEQLRAAMHERFDAILERYREPPAALTADEAALFVVALHGVLVRDDLLMRIGGDADDEGDDALRLFLADLARRALPPYDAPALTCFAWAAYAHGDGLRTSVALDRVFATNPDYTLARYLSAMLDHQINPRELRKMSTAMRAPRRRSRRRR
jgi:hypothetical protein